MSNNIEDHIYNLVKYFFKSLYFYCFSFVCVLGVGCACGVAPVDATASDPLMCLGEMEFGSSVSALWTRPLSHLRRPQPNSLKA